jgi:hypothetical protein
VRNLSVIHKAVLVCAAVAAVVGGRPSFAADPPRAILDGTLTAEGGPVNVFIADGAQEFAAATVGARFQMLEDQTFTITGGGLPPIVGQWSFARVIDGRLIDGLCCFWAETDQIELNGYVNVTEDQTGFELLYFVQVNAPRTDSGSSAPAQASAALKPTSYQAVQGLKLSNQGGTP